LGGGVFKVAVIVAVLWVVVLVFLGPWLSSNDTKVLSFGIAVAAFIILFVLPLTTSIHLPSSCSLLIPCPPCRQSLLFSFFLGLRSSLLDESLLLKSLLLLLLLLFLLCFLLRWFLTLKLFSSELSDPL